MVMAAAKDMVMKVEAAAELVVTVESTQATVNTRAKRKCIKNTTGCVIINPFSK